MEDVTGGVTGLSGDPGEGDGSTGFWAEADTFEVTEDIIGGHGVFSGLGELDGCVAVVVPLPP